MIVITFFLLFFVLLLLFLSVKTVEPCYYGALITQRFHRILGSILYNHFLVSDVLIMTLNSFSFTLGK